MTHKCRGSIIVLSISKSVEPNEEQKEMTSNKGKQGAARWPNPFCSKGQAWMNSYIKQSAPEDTWDLLSS